MIWIKLRLWHKTKISVFIRRYSRKVEAIKRLKLTEDGKVTIKLDPKIEELKDKLIYCDYIERRKLKFGFGINKSIENEFKQNIEQEKFNEIVNKPIYSIALKYLKDDVEIDPLKKNPEIEAKDGDDVTPESTPIYMPYSKTDKFDDVEEKQEEKVKKIEPNSGLIINQKYKDLYEKYLDVKNDSEVNPESRRIKKLEQKLFVSDVKRPADSLENVPPNWMSDYQQFKEDTEEWNSHYGTSDYNIPVSKIPCGGCGALLHCQDPAIPGYLPSELFVGLSDNDLKATVCQRCTFMKNYSTTLEVKVSPDDYPKILKSIQLKKRKAAVMLIIDLMDFPCSIWPNLTDVVGKYTPIFVVGNKVDLLPRDSPQFFNHVKECLETALQNAGIIKVNIKHTALISAKTGYGVEQLINKLHSIWENKGDIYMIGCTNVGKSMLFNSLLHSDYCKVQAVDFIQKATVSPWPGTTLYLLKFPILNPLKWRLRARTLRCKEVQRVEQRDAGLRDEEFQETRDITLATLRGSVGRTYSRITTTVGSTALITEMKKSQGIMGIDETDDSFKQSKWCYDTPGVISPDQILHFLTTQELLLTIPKQIISPRSFIFKPSQTLFLAGLGRLDMLTGPEFIRITVFASNELPITICSTEEADFLYDKLLYTKAFLVPTNDPERLKIWPKLMPKEISLTGISKNRSVGDILLSSAGWIAITPNENEEVSMRAWTPEGRGIFYRTPALLPKSITLRGPRIKSSAAYRLGRQVYVKN